MSDTDMVALADWPAARRFLAEQDRTFTLVPESRDPPLDAETVEFRRRLGQQIAQVFDVEPQHIGVCAHAGAGHEWWGWRGLCPAHAAVSIQRFRGQRARLRRMHSVYRRGWRTRRKH